MERPAHPTTRRAFIATAGFGGLSLYGLWAAYGAAPTPLALLSAEGPLPPSSAGEHAQHGVAAEAPVAASGGHAGHSATPAGPSVEEFSRQTAEFVERYRLPDGSVYPRRVADHSPDPHAGHTMPAAPDPHAGHDMSASDSPDHTAHGQAPAAPPTSAHAAHDTAPGPSTPNAPIDVLMTAGRWYYLPNLLRLDAGQPYRFRMMAVDIAHGASIQLGQGARMMRLQAGRVTEAAITFQKPGRYLMYCTVYCGEAHQLMQATIEVV